jgi:xanthine dehydrogenase molybdopterin-binding subunit B
MNNDDNNNFRYPPDPDLSAVVMDRSFAHTDCCYWILHAHFRRHVCNSVKLTPTAIRVLRLGGLVLLKVNRYIMECIKATIVDNLDVPIDNLPRGPLQKW